MLFDGVKAAAPQVKQKRYENYHVDVAFSENYKIVRPVQKPRPEKRRGRTAFFHAES